MEYIIKGLALYFPPVNFLSKQKHVMRRGIKKPRGLIVGQYVVRFIELNNYLASFPGSTLSEKLE